VTGAGRDALFASGLQPSDAPTAELVAQAIRRTLRQCGPSGCTGRMAQEFGDHPDAAAMRRHWVRQLDRVAGLDVTPRWEAGDGRDL
jgi:hypothetical protein